MPLRREGDPHIYTYIRLLTFAAFTAITTPSIQTLRMKKMFTACFLVALTQLVTAQITPRREKSSNSLSGAPLQGATIDGATLGTVQTNDAGIFEFRRTRPGSYPVSISSVGYARFEGVLHLTGNDLPPIRLSRIPLFMQPIEVREGPPRRGTRRRLHNHTI